jgi:hypothetical protein
MFHKKTNIKILRYFQFYSSPILQFGVDELEIREQRFPVFRIKKGRFHDRQKKQRFQVQLYANVNDFLREKQCSVDFLKRLVCVRENEPNYLHQYQKTSIKFRPSRFVN